MKIAIDMIIREGMVMATQKQIGTEPKAVDRGGRPPALKPRQVALLRGIVLQMPHATLAELAAELERQGSVRVCTATIRRILRAQGIVRLMPERRTPNACAPDQAKHKRYGYTAAHRREVDAHYSTDLTDVEWLLVSDLFERPEGQRGSPVRYERRHLVDACCYLLRTGCAWRLLPSSFAPWQAVYKASCGGSMPAPSSACRTVCADSGAFAWDAAPSPVPR